MDGFYIKPNSLLKLQNKVRKIKVTPPPCTGRFRGGILKISKGLLSFLILLSPIYALSPLISTLSWVIMLFFVLCCRIHYTSQKFLNYSRL